LSGIVNAGLILAGGNGSRLLGYDKPKQFIEVCGKPLIRYCLRAFERCSDITCICIVAADEWRGILGNDYIFAEPGKSRQHSVYNGLLALGRINPENVIIHDAARPLVTASNISALIRSANNYDGATPALPVTDTIYLSGDGKTITQALNRDELFAGQTPECYNYEKYINIHWKLSCEELANIRGSSEIAFKYNMKIAVCEGSPDNFKITTKADLERFREIMEKRQPL